MPRPITLSFWQASFASTKPCNVHLPPAGILTYRLLPLPKPTLKTIHAVVNGVGLFFAFFGLWAVLKFHALRQIPDFYSLHSWFGIATIVLFLLQVGLYPCSSSEFLSTSAMPLPERAQDSFGLAMPLPILSLPARQPMTSLLDLR